MNAGALQLMVGFPLLHSDPHTHTDTQNRDVQESIRKEFSKKIVQTALIRHRAQADKEQYELFKMSGSVIARIPSTHFCNY